MKQGRTDIAVAEQAVVEAQIDSCSHQDLTSVGLEESRGAEELVPHANQGSWVVAS